MDVNYRKSKIKLFSRKLPAGCSNLSRFPENLLRGCNKLSGTPENLLQGCDDFSELPENMLQGCGKLSEGQENVYAKTSVSQSLNSPYNTLILCSQKFFAAWRII
ncbi:hypothetical protein [Flavobacterium sp. B17]|uniref:hypothetical protein n=1 Tax=Flavobacterium sp. B17 TaxID=95618 RepID=UPI00034BEC9D|nr:hypothetical protein [Flavobacterium sp. B17]